MVNKNGLIFCEVAAPVDQIDAGVYAFCSVTTYTLIEYWQLSKYVWLENENFEPTWLKNPERDINGVLAQLTDEEEQYFFLVKIKAKYI